MRIFLTLLLCLLASRVAHAANEDDDARFIRSLPKAELHVHLEGTLEPEMYLQLARRNGVQSKYRTPEELRDRLREARDLASFIAIYEELVAVLRTREDFRDLAMAYFRRARKQGVLHAEVYVDPQLHVERGVPLAALWNGLADARDRAREELGLSAGFILSFLRDRPANAAAKVLEDSRPWFGLIVGVGLDNPEVSNFPEKFVAVYQRAAALGLHRTTHCDVDQPNTVEHHWGAIRLLGVERIDHGLNVLDDPALVAEVRARGIALTAAPTLYYREIPGRMERRAGAIRDLLAAGLLVSVNSDDPGLKRSLYVADLMQRVAQTAGLSRADLVQLARNSFQSAWLEPAERARYLAMLDP
jgi:adenine deaminase